MKTANIRRTYPVGSIHRQPDFWDLLPTWIDEKRLHDHFNEQYDIQPPMKPFDAWISLGICVGSAIVAGFIFTGVWKLIAGNLR